MILSSSPLAGFLTVLCVCVCVCVLVCTCVMNAPVPSSIPLVALDQSAYLFAASIVSDSRPARHPVHPYSLLHKRKCTFGDTQVKYPFSLYSAST